MGVHYMGGVFTLDKESEARILELAIDSLKQKHKNEYDDSLKSIREIVYLQEVSKFKHFLETKHPDQVEQIHRLRAILNHERGG